MANYTTYGNSFSSYIYLLDKYNNSQGGYSVRKLREDYTGYCMEVLRFTDSATLDIGFVNNELDTTSILTFLSGDKGLVRTWYNQSLGGGENLVASTVPLMPEIANLGVINTRNGKPSLRFQDSSMIAYGFGTSDTRSNFITYDTSGAFTGGYHNVYVYLTPTGSILDFQQLALLGGNIVSNYPTASIDQTAYMYTDNASQIVAQLKYPSGANYYKNNLTTSAASGTQNLADSLNLGRLLTNYLNGNIQEMIVFEDNKTAEVNDIILDTNEYFNVF